MKRYLEDKNVLAGLVFLVFDIFYLIFGLQIPVADSTSVGAGFMPRVYGFCMLVIAIILLVTSIFKVRKEIEKEGESQNPLRINPADLKRIGGAFVVVLLYVVLLQNIGFLICSVPLLFALVVLLSPAHVKQDYIEKHGKDGKANMVPYYGKILIFSVIYTVLIYILFAKGLGLKMPAGVLKNVLPF